VREFYSDLWAASLIKVAPLLLSCGPPKSNWMMKSQNMPNWLSNMVSACLFTPDAEVGKRNSKA
jgi:hypothetical protein